MDETYKHYTDYKDELKNIASEKTPEGEEIVESYEEMTAQKIKTLKAINEDTIKKLYGENWQDRADFKEFKEYDEQAQKMMQHNEDKSGLDVPSGGSTATVSSVSTEKDPGVGSDYFEHYHIYPDSDYPDESTHIKETKTNGNTSLYDRMASLVSKITTHKPGSS